MAAPVAIFLSHKEELEIMLQAEYFGLLGLDLVDYVSDHVPLLTPFRLLQVPKLHRLVLMLRGGALCARKDGRESSGHLLECAG